MTFYTALKRNKSNYNFSTIDTNFALPRIALHTKCDESVVNGCVYGIGKVNKLHERAFNLLFSMEFSKHRFNRKYALVQIDQSICNKKFNYTV